jgi:uncharacterized protein (TIGR02145 family)
MKVNFYLFGFLIAIVLIFLALSDTRADYVCGDANSDGTLNVSDAVYIVNHVFIGGPAPDSTCCDSDCPPVATDIDGNTYFTVKIGDQCWMAQNLKVTKYRNGDPIPNVTDNAEWTNFGEAGTGAFCNYDNDEGNVEAYGRLYNWFAVADSRNIAPEGWHVPTDEEWKQLEMYLGMSQAEADAIGWRGADEGGKLKEVGTIHWASPNEGATNASGFSTLPGGFRVYDGNFLLIGYYAVLWSSTEYSGLTTAWTRTLTYDYKQVNRHGDGKACGFSVRCVKD